MAEKGFEYDPEKEEKSTAVLRLPFALCKQNGIQIQDWWTPKDAWEALKKDGIVDDPSDEMKKYYLEQKKERQKANREINKEREKRKKEQLASPEHTPIKNYEHQEGKIAGIKKGKPMTFEEADNGKVNPNFRDFSKIGYRHNCQTCVATYFARRMGYDVKALPNLNNKNIHDLSYNVSLAYVDENGNHPSKNEKPKRVKVNEWLENSIQEGEIHALRFTYAGKNFGHIITVEKVNGKVKYYDPQSNMTMDNLSRYGSLNNYQEINLSKCKLDEKFCDEIMIGYSQPKNNKSFSNFKKGK